MCEMSEACSTQQSYEKCVGPYISSKNSTGKGHLVDLNIGGKIILSHAETLYEGLQRK